VVVRRRNPAVRVAKWFAIILGLIVIAVAGFLIWLNSDPGRRFIVERINNLELASGLKINVERIDGNIWSDVTLRGLTLSDPQGAFLAVPEAQVDYDLMSYVRGSHINIDTLRIPQATLARLPALRTVDPDAPLIPNILLDIGRLDIGRLILEPPLPASVTSWRSPETCTSPTAPPAPRCRWSRCRARGLPAATA
jgi:translocation and assembly module TamB